MTFFAKWGKNERKNSLNRLKGGKTFTKWGNLDKNC